MQPTFGCPLNRLVFEKVDAAMIAELNHMIRFGVAGVRAPDQFHCGGCAGPGGPGWDHSYCRTLFHSHNQYPA